jgi:hypothetical protein
VGFEPTVRLPVQRFSSFTTFALVRLLATEGLAVDSSTEEIDLAKRDTVMSKYMEQPVEVTRARYRPDWITTLFVYESAPVSGAFFYHGDSAMLRYMQQATEAVLPTPPVSTIHHKILIGICHWYVGIPVQPVGSKGARPSQVEESFRRPAALQTTSE